MLLSPNRTFHPPPRPAAAAAAAAALAALLGAQQPEGSNAAVRLLARIERPMVYVAFDARTAVGTAGEPGPLLRLLADPSLPEVLGEPGAAAGMFDFLRGIVQRGEGEVELAITGILPGGAAGRADKGLPLVVVRAQLSPPGAERMRQVLAGGGLARPLRVVHGQQTFALQGTRKADAQEPIEVAMVGVDLLAANHQGGLEEALDDGTVAGRAVLAADPTFVDLRARLQPAPDALLAFADWRRFGARLRAIAGSDLHGFLIGWSGLGQASAVMLAIAPRQQELQSTVLLSFPRDAAIDGWLALVQPAPARTLVDELPVGSLGGVVLAIEPKRLVDAVDGLRGFAHVLHGGCGECGLDLGRLVRRLGQRGVMQLLLVPGAGPAVGTAFAVQAQSRKAAADVFDEVQRAALERQRGRPSRGRERGSPYLELTTGRNGGFGLQLGVVDDLLVFANAASSIDALQAERRAARRGRREAAVGAALQAFGGDKVGGLVHFDTTAWFEAVAAARSQRQAGGAAKAIELPARHTGVVDVLAGGGATAGAVVRLRMLSSR